MEIAYNADLGLSDKDYELLNNQLNSQFIDTKTNMDEIYGIVFGDIFRTMWGIAINKGMDEAQARFNNLKEFSKNFKMGTNVNYDSSIAWFLETYDNLRDGTGDRRNSFFNYYLENVDSDKIEGWNKVLEKHEITVECGNSNYQGTHFIANTLMIDNYIKALDVMDGEDGELKMSWREGYRSEKEYLALVKRKELKGLSGQAYHDKIEQIYKKVKKENPSYVFGKNNGHCNNESIDITGIQIKENGKFRYFARKEIREIGRKLKALKIFSFMELKPTGFHIQTKDKDKDEIPTSLAYASWPSGSEEEMKEYVKMNLEAYLEENYPDLTDAEISSMVNEIINTYYTSENIDDYLYISPSGWIYDDESDYIDFINFLKGKIDEKVKEAEEELNEDNDEDEN